MTDIAPQRIAVIGAGISGLVVADRLDRDHDVTLIEADTRPGGHTHTVEVDDPRGPLAIDTGFIVFNEHNYPCFSDLLDELGIASQPTDMSFSVRCDRSGLEWAGSHSLDTVFGQRRNLVRPSFWRMLVDILRFGREAERILSEEGNDDLSVRQFAARGGYGEAFVEHYLLPLGASLWSCPSERFGDFPVRFVIEFLDQHGMLRMTGRPAWRTVRGGARRYVDALLARWRGALRLGEPVRAVRRHAEHVEVTTPTGTERFDEVVLACHADQALELLGEDASRAERELLGAFPYTRNEALLHTDTGTLPRTCRCWAAWNHRRPTDPDAPAPVTYNMNILQRLPAAQTWCLTLDGADYVDPARVVRRIEYHHPQYTPARAAAQARHHELIRTHRTSFCGAYWGFGFHEDGVRSGLAVADAFAEPAP
ncbi:MAG: FAD-dependent oxidoreductase [Halofilum sp. (in: g-proteobacteria)]